MATYTVTTYRCPRCRADVGRRVGLYTRLMIDCPNCKASVRIGRDCVAQNWAFNFAWVGGLVIWLLLAVGVLVDPGFAATIGQKAFPADTFERRLVIAGVSVLPALLAALVVGGVGWLCGKVVKLEEPAPAADDPPAWQPPGLKSWSIGGLSPSEPAPSPKPRRRSIMVRGFFALLWPVVFLFGAALVLGVVAAARVPATVPGVADDARAVGLLGSPLGQGPLLAAASALPQDDGREQRQQQAAKKMGEQAAPFLLLGMLAVLVLGCVGVLPWTGAGKRTPPEMPAETENARRVGGPR